VPIPRGDDRVLVVGPQRDQGLGQAGTDLARVDLALDVGREPAGQHHSPAHPVRFALQRARDRLRAEPVVVAEGGHDPSLVEDRERAARRVRAQHQPLRVGDVARLLDEHRDAARALVSPALERLEAVDDLIARAEAHDAQRLAREGMRREQPDAALAKRSEARAQL